MKYATFCYDTVGVENGFKVLKKRFDADKVFSILVSLQFFQLWSAADIVNDTKRPT